MRPNLLWSSLNDLIWCVILLIPFILVQRRFHRDFQYLLMIITRKISRAITLFAIFLLPGVFIHEFSHLLVAHLVGVRTGSFSLIPRPKPGGKLQLGYVEIATTDLLRASLIGLAPLVSGGLVIAVIASRIMDLPLLWEFLLANEIGLFWLGLKSLPQIPYFWLWFYLTFTISSTMLPSKSDRHAWVPLGIVIAVLLVLVIISGVGPWMLSQIAPGVNRLFQSLGTLFGLSTLVHLLIWIPVIGLNKVLIRIFR